MKYYKLLWSQKKQLGILYLYTLFHDQYLPIIGIVLFTGINDNINVLIVVFNSVR